MIEIYATAVYSIPGRQSGITKTPSREQEKDTKVNVVVPVQARPNNVRKNANTFRQKKKNSPFEIGKTDARTGLSNKQVFLSLWRGQKRNAFGPEDPINIAGY